MLAPRVALFAAVLALAAGSPARADGLAPPGSTAEPDGSLRSARSFRDTVRHVDRALARRGVAVETIGPYRRRGTTVVRFVATDPTGPVVAVHVWQRGGKTFLAEVVRANPGAAPVAPRDP